MPEHDPSSVAEDRRFMQRALDLAARGLGETNPNPMVGCVIVRHGRVVGEGYHRKAGAPHAEIEALAQAGVRARGATLYLNLEPCSHFGRTPPCAPRLVEARIKRAVVAIRDPNPLVSGRGLRILRRAGVQVTTGALRDEALLLNQRFIIAARKRRPFVLLKAALTLDGRIATALGESKWITGPAERRQARRLRGLHDAVLVGIGTVLADDPELLPEPRPRRPFYRVVLDSRLRLPPGSRLARSTAQSPVIALCREAAVRQGQRLDQVGVSVCPVPSRRGRIDLSQALAALFSRGITSVMVEGGSETLGSFLSEGLFDQIALFRAPLLLGGRDSRPAFGGPNPARLAMAHRLRPTSHLLRGRGRNAWPSLFEVWYPQR